MSCLEDMGLDANLFANGLLQQAGTPNELPQVCNLWCCHVLPQQSGFGSLQTMTPIPEKDPKRDLNAMWMHPVGLTNDVISCHLL